MFMVAFEDEEYEVLHETLGDACTDHCTNHAKCCDRLTTIIGLQHKLSVEYISQVVRQND